MFGSLVLVGAYGRDYKSKKALLADWHAGMDFRIYGGQYCSIRDIAALRAACPDLWFRYNGLRMTMPVPA